MVYPLLARLLAAIRGEMDMMLFVRMALYALSAGAAGYGFGTYDADAGTLTLNLDQVASIIGGAATFLGTFWTSRVAKARGGKT